MSEPRRVISFSCGASSAVLAKIATQMYENIVIVYCDTGGEHESNRQFLRDVEEWLGREITIFKNPKYKDHFDVFRQERFIAGPRGAACTKRLKVDLKKKFSEPDDVHLLGFTVEETKRAENFDNRNLEMTEWLLINKGITKADCLGLLHRSGIKLPVLYDLGYNHNNCIGCCKGGAGYWNKIRVDFPEQFNMMAQIEREIGFTVLRHDNYLDELNPRAGNFPSEKPISCGIECEIAYQNIMTLEEMD